MDLITILLIVLSGWSLALTIISLRLLIHYRALTKGATKKDLLSSLNHLIAQTKSNQEDIQRLKEQLDKEIKENRLHLQKIGFKRFNPFTDTGGNQSFSFCLLDENSTGIVISSLHSRESTRLYAKKLTEGKTASGAALSAEEKEVIKQAQKN